MIFFCYQLPETPKTVIKSEEEVYRGPLKNYGKASKNEPTTPSKSPPAKKRRVDNIPDDSIEAKLNEIRNHMQSEDQPPNSADANAKTTPKTKKNKNKKKNKMGKIKTEEQETPDQSEQQDFDYSNVDFKKFGGGSITEQKNEIKMKFHGKVRDFYIPFTFDSFTFVEIKF